VRLRSVKVFLAENFLFGFLIQKLIQFFAIIGIYGKINYYAIKRIYNYWVRVKNDPAQNRALTCLL